MKLRDALILLRRQPSDLAEELQVALVCGCTPLHLQTFLSAHLYLLFPSRKIRIDPGTYGDVPGSLRRLAASPHEAVAVVVEWSDLDPRLGIRHLGGWRPGDLPDIVGTVDARADELLLAVRMLARRTAVALSLPTLPLPPAGYHAGWQLGELEVRLGAASSRLASELVAAGGVRLLNPARVDLLSPAGARLDVKSELAAGFPYRLEHASALGELLARLIATPTPKKGLITDLDGTLWRGILGELGAEGVAWDLDRHAHGHGLYQQLLTSLAEAGVLIAVASQNDATLVEEAFRRADCLLARDHVFPCEVHWGAKSKSVGRILQAWRVGADSVVFVDDDPMQLAEVTAAYPGVKGLLFPQEDQGVYELLHEVRDLFGRSTLMDEDRLRRESLRQAWMTAPAQPDVVPVPLGDSFLAEAHATLKMETAKEPMDPRALELINKTNQFNLNGRRFTEGAWQQYLDDPGTTLLVVSYRDKFGALGKIAVLSGRCLGPRLEIDTWVMSCRAFSRRIEYGCLRFLYDRFGVDEIAFDFQETARNGPLRTFLQDVSGAIPLRGMALTREAFTDRCPALFHVLEVADRE
jgi:FkbH-like protein